MLKETEEKLAYSLTAETTELLPFLPYLFQDFWELGIDPEAIIQLIQKHVPMTEHTRVLDLACGKGAVSVKLAKQLQVTVKGIDLIPEFIGYAEKKSEEFSVGALCKFAVGDINEAVKIERGYDCVVFGAVGDVLGEPVETLKKLKATVRQGGYVLLDNYDFITEKQWTALFNEAGLSLIEAVCDAGRLGSGDNDTFQLVSDSSLGMKAITKRAYELIEKHLKRKVFLKDILKASKRNMMR